MKQPSPTRWLFLYRTGNDNMIKYRLFSDSDANEVADLVARLSKFKRISAFKLSVN